MRTSTVQPPLGTPLNANHPLSKGLVGCWLLNEGGGLKAIDSTRLNGTDGVLTNGAVYQNTQRGNGVLFDGSNDFITVANTSNIAITTNVTISAWVYMITLNAVSGISQVMLKNNANTGFYGINVAFATSAIQFQIGGTGFTTTKTIVLKTWNHICCTRNVGLASANCKMYINGVKDVTTGNNTTTINTATAALNFGTDAVNANRQANMLLQDVKIYNRALSETEVMQLYTNPYQMYIGKVR